MTIKFWTSCERKTVSLCYFEQEQFWALRKFYWVKKTGKMKKWNTIRRSPTLVNFLNVQLLELQLCRCGNFLTYEKSILLILHCNLGGSITIEENCPSLQLSTEKYKLYLKGNVWLARIPKLNLYKKSITV